MSCGTRAPYCSARPGDPDGAWLLRSFLWINHLPNGNCVLLVLRTAGGLSQRHFGSQPRRPSCICSGLEPHCRTSRCVRPQPTPSPRYCSLTSLLGTANCTYYGVLLTAAPDHRGPPGPVTSPVAVLQPTWLRNSVTAPSCVLQLRVLRVLLPGSSSLPGRSISSGYERNHNHTTAQCLLQPM